MRKYTLYVVRRYQNEKCGIWAQSNPCVHCTRWIRKCGIQKIVYIDERLNIKVVKTRDYKTSFISSNMRLYNIFFC